MSEDMLSASVSPAPVTRTPNRVRMAVGAVVDAWKVPTVRRGFHGTLLIALGALSPAYLPMSSPFWRPLQFLHLTGTPVKVIGTLLSLAGIGLLVDAWFKLRPIAGTDQPMVAYHHLRHWAVLVVWSAPFLIAPPIFSQDAYSYAAQGWLVHNHIDPYRVGPGVLPGAFADQVSWVWRYTPAPYGPLSLQIANFLDFVAGYRPYIAACLSRIPALVGVAMIGQLVPRIAVQMRINPAPAAWFAVLNPILVIDFVGGMHNDSLMIGLVVLALWISGRSRTGSQGWWLLGAAIVGVAATIKQPALLAAYAVPLIARPWRTWKLADMAITAARVLVAIVVTLGTFALVSIATGLGFGWYNAVNVPGSVTTASPTTTIGYVLQFIANLLHLDPSGHALLSFAHSAGYVLAGVVIAVLALTVARRRPITFLSWGYLAVAFGLPALHTWYVLWGGVLFPLTRPRYKTLKVAVWATVALLAYNAVSMAIRNGLVAFGVAALVAYAWRAHLHHQGAESRVRRRLKRRADADQPPDGPGDDKPGE